MPERDRSRPGTKGAGRPDALRRASPVNALAPGPFRTPWNTGADDDPQVRHFLTAEVLLGRWAEPAELVGAALLLTDPASSYLTGVILPVDGGSEQH